MSDIIEQLKKNEKPFGLMSQEMRRTMVCDFEKKDIEYYDGTAWRSKDRDKSCGFRHETVYHLRSDYVEEPEVVKCEVMNEDGWLYFVRVGDRCGGRYSLVPAPNNPDFIGFLYEDGCITTSTRRYKTVLLAKNFVGHYFDICEIASAIVLTPTHVLFRGGSI